MNQVNYDKLLSDVIENLKQKGERKKLLLHACCAPCATACIERLKDAFDITVYFYNPNIDTELEYDLRAKELVRYCANVGVNTVVEEHDKTAFNSAVSGFEREKEGGARCEICFKLRLEKTARKAREKGFDYFATTLTVSPLKNAKLINEIGERLEKENGVKYLATDFKKRGGYLRSIELSREYNLYRQNYCGCEYSKKTTE